MNTIHLHENTLAANCRGESNVNWPVEILQLLKDIRKVSPHNSHGHQILVHRLNELYEISGTWELCAVGNLCDVIPRDFQNRPLDEQLKSLGYAFTNRFSTCVKALDDREYISQKNKSYFIGRLADALSIHMAIEKRAAELIQEYHKDVTVIGQQS